MSDASLQAVAGLIGERARATILLSLMGGRALTASELARAAGVTKQTASSHLAKLVDGHLVAVEQIGRHRYFRVADSDVAVVIEGLTGLARRFASPTVQTGPTDASMRVARVCYDHLAGDLGVLVLDSLAQGGFVHVAGRDIALTDDGFRFCQDFGVDVETMAAARRPVCLTCLDWSVRRHHLAGALGAALLARFFDLGWARRQRNSRAVSFSAVGERALRARFRYRS